MIPFKILRTNISEKTLTPAEMKKREEVAKAIERENPKMPMGMKMAIATKTAKRVAEEQIYYSLVHKSTNKVLSTHKDRESAKDEHQGMDSGVRAHYRIATSTQKPKQMSMKEEVDDEGKMAKGQLMRMVNQASALAQMMEDDKQLDGWVQSKLTMASDYLDSVHDYLMHNKQDVDEKEDELEEAAWGRDKATNLKDALNRHTEKAVAANKAGDHEAVKVHQSKMNMIKNQMAKLTKEEVRVDETKSAPKGFHFTKDGKLKRGDANQDGSGGPMLRSDPLDKQRSKVPAVSEDAEDQHLCAKHVYSEVYGEGVILEGMHADPDDQGNIEWYVVEFAVGPKKMYTEKLDIMVAEYHSNHKKKKRMTNG